MAFFKARFVSFLDSHSDFNLSFLGGIHKTIDFYRYQNFLYEISFSFLPFLTKFTTTEVVLSDMGSFIYISFEASIITILLIIDLSLRAETRIISQVVSNCSGRSSCKNITIIALWNLRSLLWFPICALMLRIELAFEWMVIDFWVVI